MHFSHQLFSETLYRVHEILQRLAAGQKGTISLPSCTKVWNRQRRPVIHSKVSVHNKGKSFSTITNVTPFRKLTSYLIFFHFIFKPYSTSINNFCLKFPPKNDILSNNFQRPKKHFFEPFHNHHVNLSGKSEGCYTLIAMGVFTKKIQKFFFVV